MKSVPGKRIHVPYDRSVIIAYVDVQTELPIFRTRHKKELETLPLFEWANIKVGQDDIDDNVDERMDVVDYQPYTMRLPYTQAQWERRAGRLAAKGSAK